MSEELPSVVNRTVAESKGPSGRKNRHPYWNAPVTVDSLQVGN